MMLEHVAEGARPIRVALVNNMPDSAFVDTEEQFTRAMQAPSDGGDVGVALYTITEIPRSAPVTQIIADRYAGLDQLWMTAPDALIVTGTEPVQVQLIYEPYWPYMAHLLEWASASVPTTLLSCLAAHASLLLFDGLERVPRDTKCSGVFTGSVIDAADPLAAGLPDLVPMPHSRVNDIPEAALRDAGYRIVVGAGASGSGWSVASRRCGESQFVLCQGHPEYGALSLLREYRRDVRRCLFGRGAVPYPPLPEGYLTPEAEETLHAFQHSVTPEADPRELWARFPYDAVVPTVQNTWAPASATLYANWLKLARAVLPAGA